MSSGKDSIIQGWRVPPTSTILNHALIHDLILNVLLDFGIILACQPTEISFKPLIL